MGISVVASGAMRRVLDKASGSLPHVDASTLTVDVARLLEIQGTRTAAGIADALDISRRGIGTEWARAGVDLFRGAETRRQGVRHVVEIAGAVGIAGAKSVAAKFAHARPRPYDLDVGITSAAGHARRGASFPSTHAAVAHAAAGVVAARGTTAQAERAAAVAAAVSDSRLYLGVHFPSDVRVGEQIGRAAAARATAAGRRA